MGLEKKTQTRKTSWTVKLVLCNSKQLKNAHQFRMVHGTILLVGFFQTCILYYSQTRTISSMSGLMQWEAKFLTFSVEGFYLWNPLLKENRSHSLSTTQNILFFSRQKYNHLTDGYSNHNRIYSMEKAECPSLWAN